AREAWRGFDFTGQRDPATERALAQRDLQMRAHRRQPFRLDGETERHSARRDEVVEGIAGGPGHYSAAAIRPGWLAAKFGCGIAASRSRVYCASGAASTRSVGPCSTILPAFMTMTRSHSRRTTLRSCDTNR